MARRGPSSHQLRVRELPRVAGSTAQSPYAKSTRPAPSA